MNVDDKRESGGGWADAEGLITADVPCVHCRYNLRTLPVAGVCPECGQPVDHSRPLGPGDVAWLRVLRRGAGLLFLAIGLGLVAPKVEWVVVGYASSGMFVVPAEVGQTTPGWSRGYMVILWLLQAVPWSVGCVALYMLLRTPRRPVERTWPDVGPFVRGLIWAIPLWLVSWGSAFVLWAGRWSHAGHIVANICWIPILVLMVYVFRHVRNVLRVGRSRRMQEFATVVGWLAVPACMVWLAYAGMNMAETIQGAAPPYAYPIAPAVPRVGPPARGAAATMMDYIIVDESYGMVRTTTAPAELLARYQQSTRVSRVLGVWFLRLISAYEFSRTICWLAGLVFVACLWWVLRRAARRVPSTSAAIRPSVRNS